MKGKELVESLREREKSLMEEIDLIRRVMNLECGNNEMTVISKDIDNSTVITITPKDAITWDKYVKRVLEEMGGKAKSNDVAKAVLKANPNIDKIRAEHATRHHLSLLLKKKMIGAVKSPIKSQGYEYYIHANKHLGRIAGNTASV
jgi:hypothetical protein